MPPARFGTFEDLLEMTAEPLRPVAVALREAIMRLHPEVSEVVRLGSAPRPLALVPRRCRRDTPTSCPTRVGSTSASFAARRCRTTRGCWRGPALPCAMRRSTAWRKPVDRRSSPCWPLPSPSGEQPSAASQAAIRPSKRLGYLAYAHFAPNNYRRRMSARSHTITAASNAAMATTTQTQPGTTTSGSGGSGTAVAVGVGVGVGEGVGVAVGAGVGVGVGVGVAVGVGVGVGSGVGVAVGIGVGVGVDVGVAVGSGVAVGVGVGVGVVVGVGIGVRVGGGPTRTRVWPETVRAARSLFATTPEKTYSPSVVGALTM